MIEKNEDEFIIGKDVLTTVGIDVDGHLEQIVVNEDIVDDDPIDLDASFTIGIECDGDVRIAVEELLDAAIAIGLNLGGDSPAKVPPLLIKLRKGAKPQQCKPRQYPPHLRKILRDFNTELERMGLAYENPEISCDALLRVLAEHVRGMKHFGLFDHRKDFGKCQEFLSYKTESKNIFTPLFLFRKGVVWVDDLLLYTSTIDEYLAKLQEFFFCE
ncbi:LOW QUALITY PROTEIN: Hypothetical protein PHPALM_11699 [Phytophthora palmivora]|uniref:Uncharacterized protein n=1 Tax=Phytophthora palmivora TaxID=4796 RepID=A0A2P4Y1K8_9STRA|nr:LOW QUALITY PROTEIN: Hypothetical protein PHPALM_11699 [Phytophthora palmivora]